jgi:transposase
MTVIQMSHRELSRLTAPCGSISTAACKPLRRHLQRRSMKVAVPPRSDLKRPYKYSKYLYRHRNRIERCFNRLKHFRRFATRFDRNDAHYLATATLASISLWLRALYVD